MSRRLRRCAAALAVVLAACVAAAATGAAGWLVDPSSSTLQFTAEQAGAKFDGAFTRFKPRIMFDPRAPNAGRFVVEVETASINTLDSDRDETLAGPDFFDSSRWPRARFETTRIRAEADGSYTALGRLTIRDVTRDVPLRFRYQAGKDGRSASLVGTTTLRRLEFGLGAAGDWRETQWVGDEVEVRFSLRLLLP